MAPERSTPRIASGAASSRPAAVSVPTSGHAKAGRPLVAASSLCCSAEPAALGSSMIQREVLQEDPPPMGAATQRPRIEELVGAEPAAADVPCAGGLAGGRVGQTPRYFLGRLAVRILGLVRGGSGERLRPSALDLLLDLLLGSATGRVHPLVGLAL